MTLDQLIAIAANLGTCIAAVLAFLALRESVKQRRETYKPQLAFKRQLVYGQSGRLNEWSLKKPEEDQDVKSWISYCARLYNIGLGPAKGLTATWDVDVRALSDEINRLASGSKSTRNVEVRGRYLHITRADDRRSMVSLVADLTQTFDFALPMQIEDSYLDVRVPIAFSALTSALHEEWFAQEHEPNKLRELSGNLTQALLLLEYSDIGGDRFTQKFLVDLSLTYMMRNPDNSVAYGALLNFASMGDDAPEIYLDM